MANSYVEIPVSGASTYTFPFPYIAEADVKIFVGGVLQTISTHYTFTSSNIIEFTAGNVPSDTSQVVRIQRETEAENKLVTYSNTGLDADDLNLGSNQNFYLAQEATDKAEEAVSTGPDGTLNVGGRLTNVSDPVDSQDAATKSWVASQVAGGNGSVTSSPTAPTSPSQGDLWIDTADNIMYVWTGSEWVNGGTQDAARYDILGSQSFSLGTRSSFSPSLYGGNVSHITQVFLNGVLLKPTTSILDFTTGDYDILDSFGLSIDPVVSPTDEVTVITSSALTASLVNDIRTVKEDAALLTSLASGGRSLEESFTATAGQTEISLANTYVQGVNNVSVYVNGVRQSAFTETSTSSITLTNPATLGDELVVVINDHSVSQDIVDSVNVSYDSSNVKAKLDELTARSITPQDFGAVADGSTDDSASLQAAIDYVGALPNGGTVDCGDLHYGVGSTLNIVKSRVVVKNGTFTAVGSGWSNSGVTYDTANHGTPIFKISGNGLPAVIRYVKLINLYIDGGRSTLNTVASIDADNFEGDGAAGVVVERSSDTKLQDVIVVNFKGYGIKSYDKATELLLENCVAKEWLWNNDVGTVAYLGHSDPSNYRKYAGFALGTADVIGMNLIGAYSKYPFFGYGSGNGGTTAFNTQFTNCHFYNGSHVSPTNNPIIYIGAGFYKSTWTNTYLDNGFVEIRNPLTTFVGSLVSESSSSSLTETFRVFPSMVGDRSIGLTITNTNCVKGVKFIDYKADDTGNGYTFGSFRKDIIRDNIVATTGATACGTSMVKQEEVSNSDFTSSWTREASTDIYHKTVDLTQLVPLDVSFTTLSVFVEDTTSNNSFPKSYAVGVKRIDSNGDYNTEDGVYSNLFRVSIDRANAPAGSVRIVYTLEQSFR